MRFVRYINISFALILFFFSFTSFHAANSFGNPGQKKCILEKSCQRHGKFAGQEPIENKEKEDEREKENEVEGKRKSDEDNFFQIVTSDVVSYIQPSCKYFLFPFFVSPFDKYEEITGEIPVFLRTRSLRI